MTIERCAPSPSLRHAIEFFAQRRSKGRRITLSVFPTARAEILFNFGDSFAIGEERDACRTLARTAILPPRRRLNWQQAGPEIDWFLVALTPAGCRLLLDRSLADLWGNDAKPLTPGAGIRAMHAGLAAEPEFDRRVAMMEASFVRRCNAGEPNAIERAAHRARLEPIPDVETVAGLAGIGPRQLRNRFRDEIGLSPKLYLRLMRFNRHLAAAHPRPWRRLGGANDSEYFDESHAHRDFRAFAGITPGQYRRLKIERTDPLVFTGAAEDA